ncbi:hypothetical protein [Sphingobium sp. ZW T5_29]|uniref:hypothetical protein n=1 Tax=Sphingobium sp. ZW T5_29 TaxID=3378077 RepID=UPI003853BB25
MVPSVISGGTALDGEETIIQTDGGGRWEISLSGIALRTPQLIRKWDAWTGYMAGGGQPFLVPLVSVQTAPRPIAGGVLARPSSISADDEFFPESVRYAAPYIVAECVSGALLRSTSIIIKVTQGARLEGGEKFSINGRAHKIVRVTARDGQEVDCVITPPTREAVPIGAAVNFEWPVVQCRAAIGQDLAANLAFGRRAEVSVSFVEDFSNDG